MKNILKSLAMLFFLSILVVPTAAHAAAPDMERVKMLMIGDRVVDIAYNLGVVPELIVVKCGGTKLDRYKAWQVEKLSCPGKFTLNREAMPGIILKKGINRIISDKSPQTCTEGRQKNQDQSFVPEHKDLTVDYVDFSEGFEPGVRSLAKLLGKEAQGEKLIKRYNQEMAEVEGRIPKEKINKKVLVLNGIYQPATGKTFMQMESKGGYGEMYFLNRLGCENVAAVLGIAQNGKKPYVTIRNLKRIKNTDVDLIVATGDTYAVQKFLHDQVKKDPGTAEIAAVKNMAVFSLPLYDGGSPLDYPEIMKRWLEALAN